MIEQITTGTAAPSDEHYSRWISCANLKSESLSERHGTWQSTTLKKSLIMMI
jgi:hypothetical protein